MRPPALAFVGRSGTGKTTLVEALVRELRARGRRVATLKHDAHDFELDRDGKDSQRFTAAGAVVSLIVSERKLGLVAPLDAPLPLDRLLEMWFNDADLVLVEGFTTGELPKIEVSRRALARPLLCRDERCDPHLLAVAADGPLDVDVPVLDLNDPSAVADFLEARFPVAASGPTTP